MTTHELEKYLERAWNDPARPPENIPVEVTRYALERSRRVRSCELRRMLSALGEWLSTWRGPRRAEGRGNGLPRGAINPC